MVRHRKDNGQISVVRRVRSCRMARHPNLGWKLLMAGADRLDGGTGTAVVCSLVGRRDNVPCLAISAIIYRLILFIRTTDKARAVVKLSPS